MGAFHLQLKYFQALVPPYYRTTFGGRGSRCFSAQAFTNQAVTTAGNQPVATRQALQAQVYYVSD